MTTIVFSTKRFDRSYLGSMADDAGLDVRFVEARLTLETAPLADGCTIACLFANDVGDAGVLESLSGCGVKMLALRSAGFNHVDLEAAERLGMVVARVPAYSPAAVAEHAVALIMGLNRKTHKAYLRVREGNFSIDGLMGFDLGTRTVGVVGLGKIGESFARIVRGFGCDVLAFDPYADEAGARDLGIELTSLEDLLSRSDIVSLHCPLTPESRHLIDDDAIARMKQGSMLINTSRGALVDTHAAIDGLKSGRLGAVGLDVYEEEGDFFFRDLSDQVLQDDQLARLLTFPNVLVTSHQAFFTHEAVEMIARTTIENIRAYQEGGAGAIPEANVVRAEVHVKG